MCGGEGFVVCNLPFNFDVGQTDMLGDGRGGEGGMRHDI